MGMAADDTPKFDATVAMSPEQLAAEMDGAAARAKAKAEAEQAPRFDATVSLEQSPLPLDRTVMVDHAAGTQSVPPVGDPGSVHPWLQAPPPSSRRAPVTPIPGAPFGKPAERKVLPPEDGACSTMPINAEQADALSQGFLDALAARARTDDAPWIVDQPPSAAVVTEEPAPPSSRPVSADPWRTPEPYEQAPPPVSTAPAKRVPAVPPRRNVNNALYDD
jgi:hypothetical protein